MGRTRARTLGYLASVSQWTTWLALALAIVNAASDVADRGLGLAAVLLLSALPHKEPRYAIPAMPFVALLSAAGIRSILTRWSAVPPAWKCGPGGARRGTRTQLHS